MWTSKKQRTSSTSPSARPRPSTDLPTWRPPPSAPPATASSHQWAPSAPRKASTSDTPAPGVPTTRADPQLTGAAPPTIGAVRPPSRRCKGQGESGKAARPATAPPSTFRAGVLPTTCQKSKSTVPKKISTCPRTTRRTTSDSLHSFNSLFIHSYHIKLNVNPSGWDG